MKPQTSEQLARAWKVGRLSTEAALRRHLKLIEVWPVAPAFLVLLPIVISYGNMGMTDKVILLGRDEEGKNVERTVGGIIEDLQLQPFLEEQR